MAQRIAVILTIAASLASAAVLRAPHAIAQQPHVEKLWTLTSLLADGFEVKAATSTQSGIVGTLVVQKDKQVFLCSSKELTIQPMTFECWPVK